MWWLNLITAIPGLLTKGLDYFSKRLDINLEKYKVDGQVDLSLVAASTAQLQAQKELAIASLSYVGDRWMRYLFAYPLGVYYAAVVVDSLTDTLFKWKWDVMPLHEPMATWSGWIVMYLFLHTSVTQFWRK